jgi:hypothetical protein
MSNSLSPEKVSSGGVYIKNPSASLERFSLDRKNSSA